MSLTEEAAAVIPGGDPARHQSLDRLVAGLAARQVPPRSAGRLVLIVRRCEGGRRESPGTAYLGIAEGLSGDAWGRRQDRRPEGQVSVMQHDVAELIANGQALSLFGDNLFLDLDLSRENLPSGARVRVGSVTLEVTPKSHDGCRKFLARFGPDALRFVSASATRHRNLRGIYMRVVEEGHVATGDSVEVIAREAPERR